MTTVKLSEPTSILVMEGLTLPKAEPSFLTAIEQAAPTGSTVTVASGMKSTAEQVGDVEVILGIVDQRLLAQAGNLRWVHATASGVDMFMFDEFIESEIVLTGEKGLVGGHLADTGMGLLLALTRQIHTAIKLGPDAWSHRTEMRAKELELEGLTMGLLGFGGTGQAMARRAAAFGMSTIAIDQFPLAPDSIAVETGVEEVWPFDQLDHFLAAADVIAICCPLTAETNRLFDHRTIAKMQPGSYLVNVTRGEIIADEPLVAALRSGHLAGAALDVAPGEPLPPGHPLFKLDNVAMTPHTAGASQLRAPRNVARFVRNLERAQRGQDLEGVVDKGLGF